MYIFFVIISHLLVSTSILLLLEIYKSRKLQKQKLCKIKYKNGKIKKILEKNKNK